MKEKIKNALKTMYKDFGVSDKLLELVAGILSASVKDESEIQNFIAGDDVKSMLKGIQSESDTLRSQAASIRKEYDDFRKSHGKEEVPQTQEPASGNAEIQELKNAIEQMRNEMKSTAEKSRIDGIFSGARKILEKAGKKGEIAELTRHKVVVEDGDTPETVAERWGKAYDESFRSIVGNSPVPVQGTGHQTEQYKPGAFSDFTQKLIKDGRIPETKN